MIRSFAVALVTVVVVSVLFPAGRIAAQSSNMTHAFPMDFTGAAPGVDLDLFLNNGKVADVTLNAQGAGSWVLDLGNLGKTKLQVYVDVCEDGKVMKVLVESGKPTPEDKGCKRRMVGGAWWSDCGVTRVTLDLTKFGMRVIGCGSLYTEPKFYGPVGGALVLGGILIGGGGGDSNSTLVSTPIQLPTVTTTTNTTVAAPPVVIPPVTTPPVNTTPTTPPPIDFSVTVTSTGIDHVSPGNFSDLCSRFAVVPIQANAPFTVATTGPGVQQPSVAGTTNTSGVGTFRVRINAFGPYNFLVTVVSSGVTRTATGTFNATSTSVACPTP